MGRIFRIADSIISLIFVTLTMAVLDAYMMVVNLNYGYFIIGDVAVLITWIVFAVWASKTLEHPEAHELGIVQTELWTAMVQWGSFTALLIAKVAVIYYFTTMQQLIGPNGVSLTSYVFIPGLYVVLVGIHHNVRPFCQRGVNLRADISGVTIDIIDILDILTMLWSLETASEADKLPNWMEIFLFAYTSTMLIFLPILALHDSRYETPVGDTHSIPYSIVYPWFSFIFVDIANITIRLVNWLVYDHLTTITVVFLGKNFIGIFLDIRYFAMYYSRMGPRRCSKCGVRFAECDLEHHQALCSEAKPTYGQLADYFAGKSTKNKTSRQSKIYPGNSNHGGHENHGMSNTELRSRNTSNSMNVTDVDSLDRVQIV